MCAHESWSRATLELTWRYASNALDCREQHRFEEHLRLCGACREQLVRLARLLQEPSPSRRDLLLERLLARIRACQTL